MSEPRKPTKAELERIVSSKPRARKEVGYFTDAGEFRRGPYYSAMVGNQVVCFKHGTYREESGMYLLHADALQGAKLFQEKARELLASGDYAD